LLYLRQQMFDFFVLHIGEYFDGRRGFYG